MIKVLSIGNSFSQDAQRYLHQIAKSEGVSLKCANLYIGACSLRTHYMNMLEDKYAYVFEFNGENTGISVSLSQALKSDDWDYVTLQQVSSQSPYYDTYIPYVQKLAEYVRMYSPKSKILLHQTWAYEQDCIRLTKELGYKDQHDMLRDITATNEKASELIQADGIIPCGEAMMRAIDKGLGKLHRDTFHADLGLGRYLLALVWYMKLTGQKMMNSHIRLDVDVDEQKLQQAKELVQEMLFQ